MFCSKCGKEINDEAYVCPFCGCLTGKNASPQKAGDAPNTGAAVLGFLIPVVGLILYLVWKDQTPLKAKSAGKGALIGTIVSIVLGIIYGILVAAVII